MRPEPSLSHRVCCPVTRTLSLSPCTPSSEGRDRAGQERDTLAEYQWLSFPAQQPPGKVPRNLLLHKDRAFLKKHPTYLGFYLTAAR